MLTKKKRRMLKITIPVVIVILIISILVVLYLKTDMFKSDETLFFKYLGKNFENISEIQGISANDEISNLLEDNKYIENDEIAANYIENYGTTSENTNNVLNKLKLKVNREIDKENNYQEYNVELLNEKDKNLQIEILKNEDIYQMSCPEIYEKSIKTKDLNFLFEKIGYKSEFINNLEEIINLDGIEEVKFAEEELESLKEKYIEFIKSKTEKNKFSKRTNQKIAINNKEMTANEYTLTMTKEEYNNLFIELLNEFKNDEIILKKIDDIQAIYDLGLKDIKGINIKDLFLDWIEETINEINRKNIGIDETKIIVYEKEGKTISTIIETVDYELDFDNLYEDEKFCEIILKKKENETQKITLDKKDDTTTFTFAKSKDTDKIRTFEIERKNMIENNDCQKNTIIKYEDKTNKIEARYDRKIELVNNIEVKKINKDSVDIDKLENDKLEEIMKIISDNIKKEVNEILQNISIEENFQKILKNIGIKKEAEEIISEGTSESEKNRYNSKFEILRGEKLAGEEILRIIDSIQSNIINLEVESNTKLKIKIDKFENNESLVKKLQEYIEKNKNRSYDIDVEYNDATGLVEYVILKITEKK